MKSGHITLELIDGERAITHLDELRALYTEVYADPPYEWGDEHLVRLPWRRQHLAEAMHDLLLNGRPEERAMLTALPAAEPAQTAYRKWGWRKVAQKHNPLPGSPLFDVLIKELANPRTQ
jgi:hypothetical protein